MSELQGANANSINILKFSLQMQPVLTSTNFPPPFRQLLVDFKDVFNPSGNLPPHLDIFLPFPCIYSGHFWLFSFPTELFNKNFLPFSVNEANSNFGGKCDYIED